MSAPTKTFHLGDLLSVTTGRIVSPDGIGGVYRVVDFVTGQQHLTHQLPRACEETVAPEVRRQQPILDQVEAPEEFESEAHVISWLSAQVSKHGEWFEIDALPEGAYVGREPTAELRQMAPHLEIIIEVDLPGGAA